MRSCKPISGLILYDDLVENFIIFPLGSIAWKLDLSLKSYLNSKIGHIGFLWSNNGLGIYSIFGTHRALSENCYMVNLARPPLQDLLFYRTSSVGPPLQDLLFCRTSVAGPTLQDLLCRTSSVAGPTLQDLLCRTSSSAEPPLQDLLFYRTLQDLLGCKTYSQKPYTLQDLTRTIPWSVIWFWRMTKETVLF